MGIPDEEVAQVRAATDLVALIGEKSALRRQGRRWVGLCPFHQEKSPSFSVNAEEGFYYCFGCQASGDAITFVRETEHCDFVDAIRLLADRSGILLHEDATSGRDHQRRGELFEAMEKAVEWYHERLLTAPDAGAARDYLRSRGYDGDLVRRYRLGWAPDEWDALAMAFDSGSPSISKKAMSDAGLAFVNRRNRLQDSFRGRVIFPICDPSGRPVALGGRILPGRAGAGAGADASRPEPKYKNSIETPIYAKRRTLYGLNWAKQDIISSEEVVVCEGYTDVIGCYVAGIGRAVATCGTALAEEHFALLRNFGNRIVLAYDADTAGQNAAARFYEWERRHEIEVRVAALPSGSDPGELARNDPDALRAAIEGAQPFLGFRVDAILQHADLSTPESRAKTTELALDIIAEHPSDLVRDQYLMTLADFVRLDADRLRGGLEIARSESARRGRKEDLRRHKSSSGASPRVRREHDDDRAPPPDDDAGPAGDWAEARPVPAGDTAFRPGLEALRLAVHLPDLVADRLDEVLFLDDLQRRAFGVLIGADDLHEAIDEATTDIADLLRRLLVEEPLSVDDPLMDPVDGVVFQLVRDATRRALEDLAAAERLGQIDLGELSIQTRPAQLALNELADPTTCRDAEARLVAWLKGRRE